jgi:hypothetical protein
MDLTATTTRSSTATREINPHAHPAPHDPGSTPHDPGSLY